MGEAVALVGKLGGHLGRSKDPPPGNELLWRGYSELQVMVVGYELGRQNCRSLSSIIYG